MLKIAILISGGGSNMLSIIDSIESGVLKNVQVECVISDRNGAMGVNKAKEKSLKVITLDRELYGSSLNNEILKILKGKVDIIVLAGYLSILDGDLIRIFNNRIINIHPSLIPSFCGRGMYGLKVHEAAINKKVKYSGCTVHFVNNQIDGGNIIDQRVVEVYENDTPTSLQKRVLEEEHKLLPKVIKDISEGKIKLQEFN